MPIDMRVAGDANGNTLSDAQGRGFTWDFENRLVQATNPGVGTTTFRYDPFGRRIQKSGPLGTTNYLYDRKNLLEEVDNSGSVLSKYAETRGLDEALTELRSGTTSYYQTDGLGSATSLSNAAGALANTYTYDAYGNSRASTGTLTNQFQYTGREIDSETGLYFNRARYYDPKAGRFISEDPVGFLGGINKYAYVLNRPTDFSDPSGLDCPEYPIDCVHTPDERAQMQREHDQTMQDILGPDPWDESPKTPLPPPQPRNCDRLISESTCVKWTLADAWMFGFGMGAHALLQEEIALPLHVVEGVSLLAHRKLCGSWFDLE